jgi:hypothetical protein
VAILTAFDRLRAWLYRNSRKPHGQAVSRAYREVLAVLLSFAVKYGRCYPSVATIARLACCSERTVGRALAWLRTWGFLSWLRRIKRMAIQLGTLVRQTSNAYRLAVSGLAALGAGILGKGAGGHNCRPSPITPPPMNLFSQKEAGSAMPGTQLGSRTDGDMSTDHCSLRTKSCGDRCGVELCVKRIAGSGIACVDGGRPFDTQCGGGRWLGADVCGRHLTAGLRGSAGAVD